MLETKLINCLLHKHCLRIELNINSLLIKFPSNVPCLSNTTYYRMCTKSDADSPHACDMCKERLLPNEKDIFVMREKGINKLFYTNCSSSYYKQIIMTSADTPVTILKLEQQVEW